MKYVTCPVTIGIDPGLSGAIAFIPHDATLAVPWVEDMPVVAHSPRGFVKRAVDVVVLAKMLERYGMTGNATVFLERVNAFPGQGVGSMFSLGMSFWGVAGVVAACGMPLHLVEAKDWKAHYKLKADKEMARALASRYYPDCTLTAKKHHGRAEALLIARYGKETQMSNGDKDSQ